MNGLTLKVSGLAELRRKLGSLPQHITTELDAELNNSARQFENQAAEGAPIDEGRLKNLISYTKVEQLKYEVVSAAKYSAYVEFGTRRRVQVPEDLKAYAAQFQGKGGGSGDGFFEAILDWVKRKGIRFESAQQYKTGKKKGQYKQLDFETTAWFIYHHLLLNGVRPHPFFFKQRASVMEALKARLEPMVKRALAR